MSDNLIETVAKKIAVANNGGDWATHYVEAQKDVWRQRAKEIIEMVLNQKRSFKVADWFHVKGRGWVATTHADKDQDRFMFEAELLGTAVWLDGVEYICKGVELNRPGTPVSVGEGIGILVGEIAEDQKYG